MARLDVLICVWPYWSASWYLHCPANSAFKSQLSARLAVLHPVQLDCSALGQGT